MVKYDTVELLKETNAGVKTAVTSIDEVFEAIQDDTLRQILTQCKEKHEKLGDKTHELLNQFHDDEKDPTMVAKVMSWMKINMKLMTNQSDAEVADLMIDGADMGVKSLSRYLNQYQDANDEAKSIARELIQLEEKLSQDMRCYL